MYLQIIFLFINVYLSTFPVQSAETFDSINSWCNLTPYPTTCKYYLHPQKFTNTDKNKFRDFVIGVAKDQALVALNIIKGLGKKCHIEREKVAWSDCVMLYGNTVKQLDKALNNTTFYTNLDSQIWLSAALTNLNTCTQGFFEVGVTKNVLPLMFNNVSFLIENSLAINKPANENWVSSMVSHDDLQNLRNEEENRRRKVDLVVAKDGSGNYTTINEALIASTKMRTGQRFVIYIKKGIYNEHVEVGPEITYITLIGDGMNKSIVTGKRTLNEGYTLLASASFSVNGEGFYARDITFRNTAGFGGQQAVALASLVSSAFYRCSFEGYQDTLLVHSNNQFYSQCQILGATDFIFGNAAVVFQNCSIYTVQPVGTKVVIITAQGRENKNEPTGMVFDSCTIAPQDTSPQQPIVAYLGRPWRVYSRVVYMNSFLDAFVAPKGWCEYHSNPVDRLYYGEYGNSGPGASTINRVNWPGYHAIQDVNEARKFSVKKFISGKRWLPSIGVPFNPDI